MPIENDYGYGKWTLKKLADLDYFFGVYLSIVANVQRNQKEKGRPPFEWIVNLHNQARQANCKIYQKTNLLPGMGDVQRVREYPNLHL